MAYEDVVKKQIETVFNVYAERLSLDNPKETIIGTLQPINEETFELLYYADEIEIRIPKQAITWNEMVEDGAEEYEEDQHYYYVVVPVDFYFYTLNKPLNMELKKYLEKINAIIKEG